MYEDETHGSMTAPVFWAGGALSLLMWGTVTMLALQWM
jgi:hypothetical protein